MENGTSLAPNDIVISAFMKGALAALKLMPDFECVFQSQRNMLLTIAAIAEAVKSNRQQLECIQQAIPAEESSLWKRAVGTVKDSWLTGFRLVISQAISHESSYVSADACVHMVQQMMKYAEEQHEEILRHLSLT